MFNVVALRHFNEEKAIRPQESSPSNVVNADGHERYNVGILTEGNYRSKQQYLVKWK